MRATTVRTQKANAKETCSVEMGSLLKKKSTEKINSKSEPEVTSRPNPDSLVNERPQINDPLNQIEVAPTDESAQ